MPIITITSDWGEKDPYSGAVKGTILSKMPEAVIVEISHRIPPFDVEQAAYILKSCYTSFPAGTVHIIAVNTEESDKFAHTVVKHSGQYFIGTDSGVFSLIFEEAPAQIGELTLNQDSDYFTFSSRDRFVSAAVHLAAGKPMMDICDPKEKLLEKILLKPVVSDAEIKGHVIYIDNYENIISNISENQFKEIRKGRKFNIFFRSYNIRKISKSYCSALNRQSLGRVLRRDMGR